MDSLLTPIPGKANDLKSKINQKTNRVAKMGTSEAQRQNRVFRTTRSTNIIPGKPMSDKSITKTKIAVPQKQPSKSIRATQLPIARNKKSPEKVLNERSDESFLQQRLGENASKDNNKEKDSNSEPKTPVASSHVRTKSKVPTTPFYSAVHCSKCRFDRLETSSYWVGHIKMAESVGKHFVASNFFRLALESQAEPIRNLRMELKRYLLRHGYLSEQKEWKEVAARYELVKVETNISGTDSTTRSSSICSKNESDIC